MSAPLPGQLSFFSLEDVEEGERLREEGIAHAQGGAPVVALVEAVAMVRRLAETRRDFTTDAVWVRLEAVGGMTFPEPRAMGAVMRIAEREGYVERTEEHRLSRRPVCHRRPMRVWRSRLYRRGSGAAA